MDWKGGSARGTIRAVARETSPSTVRIEETILAEQARKQGKKSERSLATDVKEWKLEVPDLRNVGWSAKRMLRPAKNETVGNGELEDFGGLYELHGNQCRSHGGITGSSKRR